MEDPGGIGTWMPGGHPGDPDGGAAPSLGRHCGAGYRLCGGGKHTPGCGGHIRTGSIVYTCNLLLEHSSAEAVQAAAGTASVCGK